MMPTKKLTNQQLKMIVMALMMSACGFMGIDIFLPAMPAMQLYFQTSSHLIALSIPIYVISLAVSLLYYGPVSDAIGRKKVIVIGFTIGLVGIIICLLSHSISQFLLGRLIMGLGMGATIGLARTVIADLITGRQLAIYISYISMAMTLAIMLSPLLGGYLSISGWHAIFFFLLIYNFAMLVCVIFFGNETNNDMQSNAANISVLLTNYMTILKSRRFLAYALASSLARSSSLCYITLSAFLLQRHYHLSPIQFSWVTMSLVTASIIGKSINILLVRYKNPKQCIELGYVLIGLSGLLLANGYLMAHISLFYLLSCVAISMVGQSFIYSNASVGAMTSFDGMRGAVSALFGACQNLLPAIAASLIAPFLLHPVNVLAVVFILVGFVGLLSFYLLLATPNAMSITTNSK